MRKLIAETLILITLFAVGVAYLTLGCAALPAAC